MLSCHLTALGPIVLLPRGEIERHELDDPFPTGKNWIPYDDGRGNLRVIFTLDPLQVFECTDLASGRCEWVVRAGGNYCSLRDGGGQAGVPRWQRDQRKHCAVSSMRGGSSGILSRSGDTVFGFGHRSLDWHEHVPFIFAANISSGVVTFSELTSMSELLPGNGIVDPTSAWAEKDGSFTMVVTYSPRAWFKHQAYGGVVLKAYSPTHHERSTPVVTLDS